jgi:peptide/nickel transport system permease protein
MRTPKRLWAFLRIHPGYLVGWVLVAVNLVLAVIGPIIAPYPPEESLAGANRLAPNLSHLFGTDATSLDVFSRVISAPRVDLTIGIAGNTLALLIGVPLGLIGGFYGGLIGGVILRGADLVQAFPIFVMALLLVAVSGQNIANVTLAIAFVQGPIYLRLVRGEVLRVKTKRYIEAARCIGIRDRQLLFRHVLPNSLAPAAVQLSVNIGFAILLTAGLSFIGAGVRVPTPEWGSMVSVGASSMVTGQWWMAFFPGVAIGLSVLGFALVSDSLKQVFYPSETGRTN